MDYTTFLRRAEEVAKDARVKGSKRGIAYGCFIGALSFLFAYIALHEHFEPMTTLLFLTAITLIVANVAMSEVFIGSAFTILKIHGLAEVARLNFHRALSSFFVNSVGGIYLTALMFIYPYHKNLDGDQIGLPVFIFLIITAVVSFISLFNIEGLRSIDLSQDMI